MCTVKPVNVYCPECPPGGTIGHPGRQQKKFLPFGHGRDLAAFNGTGLQNKSFHDKQGLTPFGTRKTSRASGPIHYAPCGFTPNTSLAMQY